MMEKINYKGKYSNKVADNGSVQLVFVVKIQLSH